eukprot:699221-Prymnesium_polylepis.1
MNRTHCVTASTTARPVRDDRHKLDTGHGDRFCSRDGTEPWRVKEVKDAKRREGTKVAWDVLVSWAGQHEDSWVARAMLSRPLQKEVRSMLERRWQEAAQIRVRGTEARRATRAEQSEAGRRAAVRRGRPPAVRARRSERVRAASAKLEGSEESGSGEEA